MNYGHPADLGNKMAGQPSIAPTLRRIVSEVWQGAKEPALGAFAFIIIVAAALAESAAHAGLLKNWLRPGQLGRVALLRPPPPGAPRGTAYLDWLLRKFRGDVLLALAGYNAGTRAVLRDKGHAALCRDT